MSSSVGVSLTTTELIIWDLHGEDEFQTVQSHYLRGASGCIYVVDGTRAGTLEVALNLQKRVTAAIGPIPSILALNKHDLESEWELDQSLIQPLMDGDLSVIHTSAKTGASVEAAFEHLAVKMAGD